MTENSEGIYDVLRRSFLTGDLAIKNWKVFVFVVGLLLVMIWSAHSIDEKVVKIAELNKIKRELRAEYVDTSTILMRMKLESTIQKEVVSSGLKPVQDSPQKIKVIIK